MRSLGIAAILVLLVSSQVLARPQNQYLDNEDYDVENQQDQADIDDTQADAEGDDTSNNDDKEDKKKYLGPPQMKTQPLHLYVKAGENVRLPCEIINADPELIAWQKGNETIFFGKDLMANDSSKYQLFRNDFVIKNVSKADASYEWTCTLFGEDNPVQVKHRFTIHDGPTQLSRPTLIIVPSDRPIHVNEGQSISFGCETLTVPKVEIKWYLNGHKLHEVANVRQEGNYVFIEKATRHHVGVYECLAEDRSPVPKTASIQVTVSYAPVIEVTHKVIHTGIGRTSELVCKVDSYPTAQITWHKNNIDGPVYNGEKSEKITNQTNTIDHSLKIENTAQNDLGTYVCHASNNMSAVHMEVILTGMPNKPVLNHGEDKASSHMVKWRVETYSPIEQAKLEYRAKNDDKWTVVIPEIKNAKDNQVSIEHSFPNLEPGVYEVKLKAKNHFGWSPMSAVHEFRKELVADEPQNVKGHSSTIQPQAAFTALLLLVVSSRVFTCL